MTQDQINYLQYLRADLAIIESEHHRKVVQIKKSIEKLEKACNHTYPDGKSADNGGMFIGFCTICNGSLG